MAESTRKRVLILTYYWPPSGGSGVQRWLKFAKYLPTYGIEPVVVAPLDADYPVQDQGMLAEVPKELEVIRLPIREPYAIYRKLTGAKQGDSSAAASNDSPGILQRFSRWVRANFFIPDPRIWWVKPSVKALQVYLKQHPVDAIISTGPPHSVHLIAQTLKRHNPSLKWILDVRDPWSQLDVHLVFNPSASSRAKNQKLERQALEEANLVLGTAFSMPDHLEPFDKQKYVTITNGYDAADFADFDHDASADNQFLIYHTGLLTDQRNPRSLWQVLGDLASHNTRFAERLHIHLIGTVGDAVRKSLAAEPSLAGKFTITPWLSHSELIQHYEQADVFLLCPNRSDNAKGQINGKLFEYLAAKKPILHIGPYDADNTRILDEVHAGITILPGDAVGMAEAIKQLYTQTFQEGTHYYREGEVQKFERSHTTRQLAQVLNNLWA